MVVVVNTRTARLAVVTSRLAVSMCGLVVEVADVDVFVIVTDVDVAVIVSGHEAYGASPQKRQNW